MTEILHWLFFTWIGNAVFVAMYAVLLVFVVFICKAAARGDEMMERLP